MQLESVTAASESYPLASLRSEIEAYADAFRKKAHQDRSKGEVRSALRLERRAWALDVFKVHGLDVKLLIQPIDFTVGYRGKILMLKINSERIPDPELFCLRSGDDWHHEILKNTEDEMHDLGFETATVTPVGGAWVRFEAKTVIIIYGTSDTYGACSKAKATELITQYFSDCTVKIQN
ncbi:MAG: hypothetical protein ABFS43_11070 [Thermodesulfobacteriota bacterium]